MLESSLKNKPRRYFLEEIFRPVDSKSFRLRSVVFEMLFNNGVWGSSFKYAPTVSAKTVSSCSQ